MGEGDQRSPKPAAHYLRRVLVRPSQPPAQGTPGEPDQEASAAPSGCTGTPSAEGTPTTPPSMAGAPSALDLPLPRTKTLDDPLTTSLLAEVARRSRTIEVSPDQIADAMDAEPSNSDPDEPAPLAPPAGLPATRPARKP